MEEGSGTKERIEKELATLHKRIAEMEELDGRHFHALAELKEKEARIRDMADAIPGIVFEFELREDGGLVLTYVSKRAQLLLGLRPSQIMENPSVLLELISFEDFEKMKEAMQQSAKDLSEYSLDHKLRKTSDQDQEVWFRLEAVPHRLRNGRTHWNGVAMNITDRKKIEQEISMAKALLQELRTGSLPGNP